MRIMIAGGGTGGHIFPGIAVAGAIRKEAPNTEVFFMGRGGSIEERAACRAGFPFVPVASAGLRRGMDPRNLAMPFIVACGYAKALSCLAVRRADAALGTGGFASLPPALACWTLGVPLALQEQNSCPGLATRVLSRFAREVHVSFSESGQHLPHARRVVLSGNPVREGFLAADGARAREALGFSQQIPIVFFAGGSRGAKRINDAVHDAMPRLKEIGVGIIAQTGTRAVDRIRDRAEECGVRALVGAFFDDIAGLHAASDLVVSRAGATTVAEITVVGRPSVLVPYPHSTEGHQMKNARVLEAAGAAVVIPDDALGGGALADTVSALLSDSARLSRMAEAAKALARPDASRQVARSVLALAASRRAG